MGPLSHTTHQGMIGTIGTSIEKKDGFQTFKKIKLQENLMKLSVFN